MAFSLTEGARDKQNMTKQEPSLVLEIDGYSKVFGLHKLIKYTTIGGPGLYIDGTWVLGGTYTDTTVQDWISLDGTTSTISQQLLQDKGGTSSITSFQISLIDYNELVTALVSPGVVLDDVLGREAFVYLGYKDTLFPQDYVLLFNGLIDEVESSGVIKLNVANPESRKRQDIFISTEAELAQNFDYRSRIIQSILYRTRTDVVGTVTVAYTAGGTAGSEVVTVVGNAISVQIQNGVSTASQIRNKIEQSIAALSLVEVSILDGQTGTAQTTVAATSLDTDTIMYVNSVSNFYSPVTGSLGTYIQVNDEIVQYTSIDTVNNAFLGCTRGLFGTIPKSHQTGDTCKSFLRLQGEAVDLALQLMLSGPNEYYKTAYPVSNFGVDGAGNVNLQGVYFAGVDMVTKWGLTVGSLLTTTGAANAANNFSLRAITSIEVSASGTFVFVSGAPLVVEGNTSGTVSFKSQYNILPDGLGMGAHQVDINEFQRIQTLFVGQIPEYDFYLTDTVNGKDFLDREVLFPANMFSLPKKGKSSVGVVSPPLAIASLPQLNADKVTKPNSIKIKRSIGKYFYNTAIYKFNFDAVETDKPLSGYIRIDTDSQAQIPVGTKAITIISKGLRNNVDTQAILDTFSKRLLEKYKFAAEAITLSCFYSVGFNIDVGDVVLFGDQDFDLPDSTNGTRGFEPRLCEVINKSMNIVSGTVDLTIIDTSYLASGRYGIFSPSSVLGSGSTLTSLILTDSFGTTSPDIEKNKWQDYIGENILIHNDNYSLTYSTKILGFNPSNPYEMYIDPILATPGAGLIVDVAFYPASVDPQINFLLKNIFVFADPSVAVTAGSSAFVFSVGAGDVGKFVVGATVILHNADYSVQSPEVKVSAIAGTQITVDRSLGFTPSSLYQVELIGFPDAGFAYRYL